MSSEISNKKTILISEVPNLKMTDSIQFNLEEMPIKNCIGCWTCWWTTPGVCVHKDLEEFYHAYVNADKAIFIARVENEFVSSKMKTLFDRIIPLFLPYIICKNGGCYHKPRYEKYPDITFYYEGTFTDKEGEEIFKDYIYKVFEQFYSKKIEILPICELKKGEAK